MSSKNTPNGGKLLKAIMQLVDGGIKVRVDYGYNPNEAYPKSITIESTSNEAIKISWRWMQGLLPHYELEHVETKLQTYTDGSKRAHTYIVFHRVNE